MISVIVARSANNVIGKNGKMPWYIPSELQRFKELTVGNVVIMGRKTYEAIGHPLEDRMNIVISNTETYTGENLITVHSFEEAVKMAGERDVFISGGYSLYEEGLSIIDRMYITEVDLFVEDGDTFFPVFDESLFEKHLIERCEEEISYTRWLYERKEQ